MEKATLHNYPTVEPQSDIEFALDSSECFAEFYRKAQDLGYTHEESFILWNDKWSGYF